MPDNGGRWVLACPICGIKKGSSSQRCLAGRILLTKAAGKFTIYEARAVSTMAENRMSTLTAVAALATIIAAAVSVYLVLSSSINSKIEQKINDPNFVKKVASEIRLPFLIIDENEHIIHDDNAYALLKSIKVQKEKKEIVSITISPKAPMAIPPIIEIMNSLLVFNEPERANQIDWRFKVSKETGVGYLVTDSFKEPIRKFKLTFINK